MDAEQVRALHVVGQQDRAGHDDELEEEHVRRELERKKRKKEKEEGKKGDVSCVSNSPKAVLIQFPGVKKK